MAHPSPQHAAHAPSPRAILTCWAAISAAILTLSLALLVLPPSPELLLREEFIRDPSGTLQIGRDDCDFMRRSAAQSGGPQSVTVGYAYITSRKRRSAILTWEETTARWNGTRPPAAEVDAALQRRAFSTDARSVAALPTGTSTALRPSLGLICVPLFSILLVEPAFQLRRRWLDRRARTRTSRGRCPTCGYDRHGTTTIAACPECGTTEHARQQSEPRT